MMDEIKSHHQGADQEEVEEFLAGFENATIEEKGAMLKQLKKKTATAELSKKERKQLKKAYKQELVKRSAVYKIAAAWIITVPASGALAAVLFFVIRGVMV